MRIRHGNAVILALGTAAACAAPMAAAQAAPIGPAARIAAAARGAPTRRAAQPAPTVSANALRSDQTNGQVLKLAYAGGYIYAAGPFTGELAAGTTSTSIGSQAYLARFASATGTFDPAFSPTFTNTVTGAPTSVTALALSPDRTTLYVGGHFTQVDGKPRGYGAAFDLATNPPTLTSWDPKANGAILAIAPSPDGKTVYLGGTFTTLSGTARPYAGAVDAATGGTVLPWAPAVDKLVDTIAVAPDGSAVLLGGYFTTLNGVPQQGDGAVQPATGASPGASLPWPNILPTGIDGSQVLDIITGPGPTPAGIAYIAAQGNGNGNFDGDFAVNIQTGQELWENDCFGDTQALIIVSGWLYKASHASDCAYAPSGFPVVITKGVKFAHHLLTQSLTDGSLGYWNPNTNRGSAGKLGPYAFATDGRDLFVGGAFTQVNGHQQEGIAIFPAKPPAKPDGTPPARPAAPVAVSTSAGTDSVRVSAVSDPDDGTLRYYFYRDGRPIGSRVRSSTPWALPMVYYRDSGLTAGRTHYYTVRACDPSGACSPMSPRSDLVKVSSKNPPSYFTRVLADKPSFLWKLNETSGTTAFDSAKHGYRGTYEPGTSHRVKPGPIAGNPATATGFTGSATLTPPSTWTQSGGLVTAKRPVTSPDSFTIEAWFRTTADRGGEIAGFSSRQAGVTAPEADRQIWLTNDGQVAFGVHNGSEVVLSRNSYNDGRWHYVAATFSPKTGLALYVDGVRVGTNPGTVISNYLGYWRVGGGDLYGWSLDAEPNLRPLTAPNDFFLTGDIADFAVYPRVLTARQIAEHYAANYLSH